MNTHWVLGVVAVLMFSPEMRTGPATCAAGDSMSMVVLAEAPMVRNFACSGALGTFIEAPEEHPPDSFTPAALLGCMETAEEGELTIVAGETGCFSDESEEVVLRWSGNHAELRVEFADLWKTELNPYRVDSPPTARQVAARIAEVLRPDDRDGICTTSYEATVTWRCGEEINGMDFSAQCSLGPSLGDHGRAERLFVLVHDLIAGSDLTHVEWEKSTDRPSSYR